MTGWTCFTAKAWVNSATLTVQGCKKIKFKDGGEITWNNLGDQFNSIFIGTLVHQMTGKIEFVDHTTGVTAFYEIGKANKKVQDYFAGEVAFKGHKICDINGSYLGYVDFGKERWFDVREAVCYEPVKKLAPNRSMPSDSMKREDLVTLREGDMD